MQDKIFCWFIPIVDFYDQKLLKIGIHGNEVFIFAWDLGIELFFFRRDRGRSCPKAQQNTLLTMLSQKVISYESLVAQALWVAKQSFINYEVLQIVWQKPEKNI